MNYIHNLPFNGENETDIWICEECPTYEETVDEVLAYMLKENIWKNIHEVQCGRCRNGVLERLLKNGREE